MPLTFFGGIKPENRKYSRNPVRTVIPDLICVPIEESAEVIVAEGDEVAMGQPVAFSGNELRFSSVSGVVEGIAHEENKSYIAIKSDRKNTLYAGLRGVDKPLQELSFEDICTLLRQFAIVDSFDGSYVYKKLYAKPDRLKRIIINCCEADSYSTVLYRLLTERPRELIGGAKILMHALSVRKCIIVIDEKKRNAINNLSGYINDQNMFVPAFIENKYPVNEKTIMSAIYGLEIPHDEDSLDIGYIFFGAEAVIQIYSSFLTGIPQLTKAVTVSGESIAEPSNLIIPTGTPIKDLIEECGGLVRECGYVINGGIMNGECLDSSGGVVNQYTNQILFLEKIKKSEGKCIRCGRCITVCPMHLPPLEYAVSSEKGRSPSEKNTFYGLSACIECGCCDYICPKGVPLLEIIKDAKSRRKYTPGTEHNIKIKKNPFRKEKKHSDDDSDMFIPFTD